MSVGRVIFQIVAYVGKEGSLCPDLLCSLYGCLEVEVCGVGSVAKSIQDEHVQVLQAFQALRRNAIGVRAIGNVTDSKSEDLEPWAMIQANWDDGSSQGLKGIQADPVKFELRRCAGVGGFLIGKCVVEYVADPVFDDRFAVDRHRALEVELEETQIVHAIEVVGVFMGEGDRLDNTDFLPKEL